MGSHACQGAYQPGFVGARLLDDICVPGHAVLERCRHLDDVPSIPQSRRCSDFARFRWHAMAHRHLRSRRTSNSHDPSVRLIECRASLKSAGWSCEPECIIHESPVAGPTTVEPTSVIPGDHAKRSRLSYPLGVAAQIVLWSLASVAGDWQLHPDEDQWARRVFDTSKAQIASRYTRPS